MDNIAYHMIQDFILVIILVPQVGIVIDLKQPNSEVLVDQEIVAAELEAMPSLFQVDAIFAGEYGVNHDVFHSWQKILFYGNVVFTILLIQIFLENLERDGVSLLVLPEGCFLLDLQAVVGQVNEEVLAINIIFLARSPQVSLSEKVDVKLIRLVLGVNDDPHPDVELALFEEQGPLDVLLHNPLRIGRLLVEELENLPDFAEQLNSFALVESGWFEDPLIISAMFIRNVLLAAHALSDMQI